MAILQEALHWSGNRSKAGEHTKDYMTGKGIYQVVGEYIKAHKNDRSVLQIDGNSVKEYSIGKGCSYFRVAVAKNT